MTATQPKVQKKHAELFADVEYMLAAGEYPQRIAARLGTNCQALCQRLRRAGRIDLANIIEKGVTP